MYPEAKLSGLGMVGNVANPVSLTGVGIVGWSGITEGGLTCCAGLALFKAASPATSVAKADCVACEAPVSP